MWKGHNGHYSLNNVTWAAKVNTTSKSKRYSIRSNGECALKVPKFKHDTFGKCAFAVYGPLAWGCFPRKNMLCDEIEAFKPNLNTHLYVKFVKESTIATWFWRIIIKRPRMLSAQFVALYKPCKPNLNLNTPHKQDETIIISRTLHRTTKTQFDNIQCTSQHHPKCDVFDIVQFRKLHMECSNFLKFKFFYLYNAQAYIQSH